MCLEMRNDIKEGKKSIRHISYGFRQICNENTIAIFLTLCPVSAVLLTTITIKMNPSVNFSVRKGSARTRAQRRNSGGNCTGTFGRFSPSEGHISHTGVAYCLKEK